MAVITNFRSKLVFLLGKLLQPSLTSTLAYYKNSYVTDNLFFITLGPGGTKKYFRLLGKNVMNAQRT